MSVVTNAGTENVPFVVFGDDWASHVTIVHHMVRLLAKTNPILYVNGMGTRSPRWNIYDLRRAGVKLKQWLLPNGRGTESGLPNGHVYSPFIIPLNSVGMVRRGNQLMLRRGVAHLLKTHGLEAPILLVAHPSGGEIVGAIGERLLIYLVMDNYQEMPGVDRNYLHDLERILLARADLIFATSTKLQERKSGNKSEALFLPHGVDFEHFRPAADCLVPEEMKNLQRPLIGMYGTLAPWVDSDLLVQVARAFPQASVVLIGTRTDFPLPEGVPNLHWLGARPYAELPRYAAHFDVGLIPFRGNELTAYVNPLKLLEYLALGLPIVSTPLPDLSRFAEHVYIANGSEDFVRKVKLALDDKAPARRQQRIELAARESWETRVKTLLQHVEKALDRRVAA
jgi:glycosyltransferase involved in cell wall biosynthesis